MIVLRNGIRYRRCKCGLTLEALADAAGVGRSTVGNIEQGKVVPRVDTALQICGVLGCLVEDAFWIEDR